MGNTDTRTEAQNVEDSDESTSLLNQEESISKYISENSTSSCGPSPGCTAFLCGICLCQEDVRQAFTLPLCKHQFCRSCLSAYLTSQINDGHTDIRCPAVEGEANLRCQIMLAPRDVAANISDREVLAKFGRFRATKEYENMRACPKCSQLAEGSPEQPRIVCPRCNFVYCLVHSDAHPPDVSCEEFEQRNRVQDEASSAYVQQTSKNCPGCGVRTHKFAGCNHMSCSQCRANWCWLCGDLVDPNTHWSTANNSSCAGRQFASSPMDALRDAEEVAPFGRILRLVLVVGLSTAAWTILSSFGAILVEILAVILRLVLVALAYAAEYLRFAWRLRIPIVIWLILIYVINKVLQRRRERLQENRHDTSETV